jgi:hypothetical protein
VLNTDMALQWRSALDASGLPCAGPQGATALGANSGAGLRAVPRLRQRSASVAYPVPASLSEVGFGSAAKVVVEVKPASNQPSYNYTHKMHLIRVGATGGGASGPPRRRGPA